MKNSKNIKRHGNLENWWNNFVHCKKWNFYRKNYHKDDIDIYDYCSHQCKLDYQIENCQLTRDEYIRYNTNSFIDNKKIKALALFSGGLDSILSVLIIKEQGIDVTALYIDNGFNSKDKSEYLNRVANDLGVNLVILNKKDEFVNLIVDNNHGYGKNLNPCVDCHAKMVKIAWNYAKNNGFKFLISGEVLGQRGMSQSLHQMQKVDKEIDKIKKYLVRPLSAKLLDETIPEKYKWVNRQDLFNIKGKSRTVQIELAKKYNIKEYESPSGGCLLTDSQFSDRLKKYVIDRNINLEIFESLKIGRHINLESGARLIISRNKEENDLIKNEYRSSTNFIFINESPDLKGPVALLENINIENDIIITLKYMLKYCKSEENKTYRFYVNEKEYVVQK